jgi:GntR family transcriptional regulator/MocR family aminotransferase
MTRLEPVALEVLLPVERRADGTLHDQLERGLRDHVRSGRLAPGTRLPSSRALAQRLDVSRGVVLEAYAQLTAEGYLTASQGAPTRVAFTSPAEPPPVTAGSLAARHRYGFDPGLPDLFTFPRDGWGRAQRAALRSAPSDVFGEGDPRGEAALRNALTGYLGRARGAAPEPEHIMIGAGFAAAFATLCRTLADRGLEQIALEDPGWARHRLIAERAGLSPVAIPVDGQGISVEALRGSGCQVVVVTPAHQFPTGAVLSPERRTALLEWAEDEDALIVEDDYDGELRYDRDPVGALQGLAPERIAYIGSTSKRLAPALRLGWTLSPSWLTGALTYEGAVAAPAPPGLDQLTLADFISRGELDRHLRRMRLRYRARREALVGALARALPGAAPAGAAAGLFVLVALPAGCDEAAVCAGAAARGVGVDGLAWHRLEDVDARPGLVLGYGNLSTEAIARGIDRLGEAITGALGE